MIIKYLIICNIEWRVGNVNLVFIHGHIAHEILWNFLLQV